MKTFLEHAVIGDPYLLNSLNTLSRQGRPSVSQQIDPQNQLNYLPAVIGRGPTGSGAPKRDEEQVREAFEKVREEAEAQDRFEQRREETITSPFYDRYKTIDKPTGHDEFQDFLGRDRGQNAFQGERVRTTLAPARAAAVYAENAERSFAAPNPGGRLDFVA